MTVVPVNTFRRFGGGEMELRAARVGGDPVEQQVCHRVGLLLEHPVADAVQGFETVFAGDVATALLNTLLHDRDGTSPQTKIVGTVIFSPTRPRSSCGIG